VARQPVKSAPPARRGGSRRAAPPPRRRPKPGGALRAALSSHERDLAGLVLLVLAVVGALGIYADLAGPVGEAAREGAASLVGVARLAVPPVLVWAGIALIRGDGSRDGQPVSEHVRVAIGLGFVGVAFLALAHLTAGPGRWGAAVEELHGAGGLAGAVLAAPLRAVVGPWAAGAVFVAIGVLGVLVVTRATLRTVAAGAARGVRPVHEAARRWVEGVATLASERRGDGRVIDVTGRDGDAAPVPLLGAGVDEEPFDDDSVDDEGDAFEDDVVDEAFGAEGSVDDPGLDVPLDDVDPEDEAAASAAAHGAAEQLTIDLGPGGGWKLPPLSLLVRTDAQEVDRRLVEEGGRTLETALAAHGVETRLVGMTVGPQVTRYELELGPGVKVARVTSLHKDIAYAMASADVRILAPIPGRSAIGVEVPNKSRVLVSLGDILTSTEAKRATHPLEVAVGRDIAGRPVLVNLAKLPHVLVAGATGAGKSSCINSIVTSLLMRSTPDEVRLILIDPKRVEMGQYSRLPHLLTAVVTNPKKAANALSWAVKEMERRYDLLHEVGFRDIGGYNAAFDRGEVRPEPGRDVTYTRLPYIVVVVDELNDLMMVAARDVEESITRLAQMARAVGIHLVIATQRPSVNVLTGVIKANVPARMAFAVSSLTDSRVILDQPGAERLIGQGDLLFLGPSSSVAQRIQGAWVSEEEVRKVVAAWRRQAPEVTYVPGVEGEEAGAGGADGFGGGSVDDDDDEALVARAMDLVVRSQLGSSSMLQRKLRVGFARAGRIMALLEQRGVVGPSEGSKARAVLMTVEELEGLQSASR